MLLLYNALKFLLPCLGVLPFLFEGPPNLGVFVGVFHLGDLSNTPQPRISPTEAG